jgi:hypothetical protein
MSYTNGREASRCSHKGARVANSRYDKLIRNKRHTIPGGSIEPAVTRGTSTC